MHHGTAQQIRHAENDVDVVAAVVARQSLWAVSWRPNILENVT